MNLRNTLASFKRRDGTQAVRLYVYVEGKKYYLGTGITVKSTDWNAKRGEVSKRHPLADLYNAKLRRMQLDVERYLLKGGKIEQYGKKQHTGSVIAYIEEYLAGKHGLKERTVQGHETTLKRLRQFCEHKGVADLHWADIDQPWFREFSSWVMAGKANQAGLGKHVRVLKKMMRMALEQVLHTNSAYKESYFTANYSSRSDKIFLTESEIGKIAALELSTMPGLEKERDRFLVAYFFLLRFCDVVELNESSFFKRDGRSYVQYSSAKTDIQATIPVKAEAQALLEKHSYDFSFSTNQHANRELKRIAGMAGINQVITQGSRTAPKSAFVTFHTARRSGATNLRLQGASLKTIADIGGWKQLSTVELYLRASDMDSALLAQNLDFFK